MSCALDEIFSGVVAKDFRDLVIGKKLGSGASREVYEWRPDPKLVVKVELNKFDWSNIKEWDVWAAIEHTKLAQWFAPCAEIAGNGAVMLQYRTQPIRRSELPDKIPALFTDTKLANWGMLDGRPVCHDYGLHMLLEKGMGHGSRLVKADWWQ